MRRKAFRIIFIITGLVLIGTACREEGSQPEISQEVDMLSYNLGVIGASSEAVSLGIKKLALSAPLDPEEMAQILPEVEKIAAAGGVSIHLEKGFLITDLFSEEITTGKHVLLIYLGPAKDDYMDLKLEKEKLIRAGQYQGKARMEVARKMGRLLSYPEDRSNKMPEKGI